MVETRGPRLRGRLTLDTKPFRKSLNGARGRSNSAFRGMEASSKRLTGAFKALGATLAGVFAFRTITSFLRAGEVPVGNRRRAPFPPHHFSMLMNGSRKIGDDVTDEVIAGPLENPTEPPSEIPVPVTTD